MLVDELAGAVVLTLSTTPERLAAFLDRWYEADPPVPLDVHSSDPWPDRRAGNWQAHVDVLAAAQGPTLVLEDDAVFAPGFTLDVEIPARPRWDVFFLGGDHFLAPWTTDVPGVVRGTKIRQNHCYAVRDPARWAQLLGPALVDGRRVNPDGYIDGRFGQLARDSVHYAVMPFTVGQDGGQSTIDPERCRPGVEYSNRVTWPDYGSDWPQNRPIGVAGRLVVSLTP